ncbi:hypothetical protein N9R81_02965 [Flavobacteriales bacterium]|nr:hypothetical protein [Flavobacteriales bacterium]
MSGLFGAFKTRKPKQFNFTARYYDEKRERRQRAEARIKRELEYEKNADQNPDSVNRENFQLNWRRESRLSEQKKSNQRIIIIIGILAILAYVALQFV